MIGASAADIKLTGTVSVKGTDAPNPYVKRILADYYSGQIKAVPDVEFANRITLKFEIGGHTMAYDIQQSRERIRQFRIQGGYTQEKLAGVLNIDRSLLSHIEAGKRGCSVDLLIQLSSFFDVSLDLLVLGKDLVGIVGVLEGV